MTQMTIGVIGLGYVGLPLAVAFAEAGDRVVALDIDSQKVASVLSGESYIEDIPSERLRAVLPSIRATRRYADLAQTQAVLICVPTPLTGNREPDLGPLNSAARALAGVLQPGQLVVLESTTYPGTTRERLVPILEESGLKVGEDLNVAFSPERVDPGNTKYTLRNTPKVVGGMTAACADQAEELYSRICDTVVRVSTPEAAEMTKLLENIFRSVNIALVNELTMLADRMGLDVWEVIAAAATKPYGFMPFEPGPGMGGHCLPVDPFYLTWRAREFHMSTEFIELAGKINQQMPYYCVERIERALNDATKPVKGSRILILGASYKGGVGDTRESPALRIMQVLAERGGVISYHDPYVPALPELGLETVALDGAVPEADAVVLVTAHPEVDYAAVAARSALFVDLRGVTHGASVENLVRL
ncbi:MAG: nucleotide sugar dehydrogenase [Actinomycetota bacterium]|nr:nucleotide sugar dehydrogenase [Actinomycetota bacterium]